MQPQINLRFRSSSLLIIKSPINGRPIPVMPFTLQDPKVRSPETSVTQGVAHRVYSRVYVAQVIKEVPNLRRYMRTRRHRFEQHQNVIRSPCDYERRQNGRKRLSRFLVSLFLLSLLLLLALVLGCVGEKSLAARHLFGDDLGVERNADVGHRRRPPVQVIALVLIERIVVVGVVPCRRYLQQNLMK